MAKEVLEEMRRYLLADTGENREIKIDKIQRSVKLAEKDHMTQRLALRLENPPLFTTDLNKGKGIVFDYLENKKDTAALSVQSNPNKLMAASFQAHSRLSLRSTPLLLEFDKGEETMESEGSFCSNFSTVLKAATAKFAPCSFGMVKNRSAGRRRPPKSSRQKRYKEISVRDQVLPEEHREGKQLAGNKKRKSEASFKFFADMLTSCEMEELYSKGKRFTWAGQKWKKYIQCCLDWCFRNKAWRARFPNSNQTFLDKRGSDHRPVWVNLRASPDTQRGQFRFDRMLLHHPDLLKEVESVWKENRGRASVAFKIRKCRKVMSSWKRKRRFNAKEKIKDRFGCDQWSDAAKADVAIQYSRYFPNSHFLEAPVGSRPSFAWRSMIHGRELLQKGLQRSIRNGRDTRVWIDKWVYDPEMGWRALWIKSVRSWPWMIWNIWKSRNDLIFKGIRWLPEDIKEKAFNESEEWFLAQEVEKQTQQLSAKEVLPRKRKWRPPPEGWMMCNVGFEWMKHSNFLGVAWVVRNHRVVIMHSRRAFSKVLSLDEARLTTILWAVESMTSLRFNKVIFAGDFKDFFLAVKTPLQWPVLRYHMDDVSREGRFQLYVVNGHPLWMFEFFENESRRL
ncbi:hypothetical protein Bca4012_058673 [Brassica carinata]|uniref:Uncharacterized protein n=1 Tax=Brassica carinata TaxID=52824 RepID=A0A8X8B6K4_BRACI|nr:hypothetical protein Bca52824_016370 [Brassica carinata]